MSKLFHKDKKTVGESSKEGDDGPPPPKIFQNLELVKGINGLEKFVLREEGGASAEVRIVCLFFTSKTID